MTVVKKKNVYLYTSNFDLEIKQKNSCILSRCRDLLDPHSVKLILFYLMLANIALNR